MKILNLLLGLYGLTGLRPYSPTPVNVNCRLKCFVTLVTYCCKNVFVFFNLQLTLTGVGEYGPYSVKTVNLVNYLMVKPANLFGRLNLSLCDFTGLKWLKGLTWRII
jgi:hypothetical protein